MRVAGRAAEVVQGAEEEAEDDLAEAVAVGGAQLLHVLEAHAVEQFGDEHAAAREIGVDGGHVGERMPAPGARDRAVVLRLDLVVELLGDALAQLAGECAHVEPGGQALHQRQQQAEVAQVDLDGLGHARVLDLDRDPLALARDRAVHLADRGGGERLVLELREVLAQRPAELDSHELLELRPRQRRHVVAQRRERALELLALGLGDGGELDGREDLADLHRGAPHAPELLHELAREGRGALAGRRLGALGRAHQVRGAGAGPAQALAGHQAADGAGAGEAGGGRGVGHTPTVRPLRPPDYGGYPYRAMRAGRSGS